MVQKALEVRGHENVHAGRGGLEELPLCGVGAGGEEIGQHVVLIGSADQLAHGQAHALCIVACQNVAEVAGGYAEVHFIAEGDPARLEQLGIGGKVIDDLRQQNGLSDAPVRFDVAEVFPLDSGRWMVHIIRGAFLT